MSKNGQQRSQPSEKGGRGLYSVRLLIKCTGKGQPRKVPLYEDRLVLVHARSHGTAKERGRKVVQRSLIPYKNPLGETVRWKVVHVYESVELFEDEFSGQMIKDGAQVYWRYIRSRDPIRRLRREGTMDALY